MNDEIIVLRKSELRSVVAESVKAVVEDKFDALKGFIENLALKKDLPRWIKGDKAAAELLGISAQALRLRRKNGYLREGLDFVRKSDKIVLYDTDALLNLKGK